MPGYGELEVELSAGSTLVLYTDGVTEARDDAGDQFDDEAAAADARRPRLPDGSAEPSPRCTPPWRPT